MQNEKQNEKIRKRDRERRDKSYNFVEVANKVKQIEERINVLERDVLVVKKDQQKMKGGIGLKEEEKFIDFNIKKTNTIKGEGRKVIFKNNQSPGDLLMLTAAIRDLKLSHPEIDIDVDTPVNALWENNPYLTKLNKKDSNIQVIKAEYPLIHNSNEGQYHFIHGFRKDIEEKLGVIIRPTKFKGDIHLSKDEKKWISQIEEMGIKDDFWVVVAGGKYDFTCKWINPNVLQEVINYFEDRITWVQTGEKGHWHPELKNVINLVGKTNLRQLIRLIYHSVGVLTPVTFAMHAAAAIEMKKKPPINRPCVVIAGGREPVQWEAYPHHRFLSVTGCLSCCDNGGCWKSRCQKVEDGDKKDEQDTCLYPIEIDYKYEDNKKLHIAKCINMIKSKDIIRAIELYYEEGMLKYNVK